MRNDVDLNRGWWYACTGSIQFIHVFVLRVWSKITTYNWITTFTCIDNDDQEDADGDDETHEPGDQDGGQFHQYHHCPKCDILWLSSGSYMRVCVCVCVCYCSGQVMEDHVFTSVLENITHTSFKLEKVLLLFFLLWPAIPTMACWCLCENWIHAFGLVLQPGTSENNSCRSIPGLMFTSYMYGVCDQTLF